MRDGADRGDRFRPRRRLCRAGGDALGTPPPASTRAGTRARLPRGAALGCDPRLSSAPTCILAIPRSSSASDPSACWRRRPPRTRVGPIVGVDPVRGPSNTRRSNLELRARLQRLARSAATSHRPRGDRVLRLCADPACRGRPRRPGWTPGSGRRALRRDDRDPADVGARARSRSSAASPPSTADFAASLDMLAADPTSRAIVTRRASLADLPRRLRRAHLPSSGGKVVVDPRL